MPVVLSRCLGLLRKVVRVVLKTFLWAAAIFGVLVFAACMLFIRLTPSRHTDPETARMIRQGAEEGRLAYRLTEPNELIKLLGRPTGQMRSDSEDMQRLRLEWPGVGATFVALRDCPTPTLRWLKLGGTNIAIGDYRGTLGAEVVDIGLHRPIALRSTGDLGRVDSFFGFQDVSLAALDLREHRDTLLKFPFDTRTRWPGKDKLPDGFDPNALLEQGKNPGLGVRELHAQGIDGRGVGIAIIDQPLLPDHVEYAGQLRKYDKVGVISRLASAQMHGPAVAGIAVGKDCGVAPGACLYHFALMTMAIPDNRVYCRIADKILRMNADLSQTGKIRVISISYGMFSQRPHYDQWLSVVEHAKQQGILIVTCDPAFIDYGTLARVPGTDADDPANYRMGRYSSPDAVLLVPAGHRTLASENGPAVYKYDPIGGMSWAAPYLAGLAAMAFQLDDAISPDTIVELLLNTSTKTGVGPVVNPRGFIQAVRNRTH